MTESICCLTTSWLVPHSPCMISCTTRKILNSFVLIICSALVFLCSPGVGSWAHTHTHTHDRHIILELICRRSDFNPPHYVLVFPSVGSLALVSSASADLRSRWLRPPGIFFWRLVGVTATLLNNHTVSFKIQGERKYCQALKSPLLTKKGEGGERSRSWFVNLPFVRPRRTTSGSSDGQRSAVCLTCGTRAHLA